MNPSELVAGGIYGTAALLLAIALIVGFALLLHAQRSIGAFAIPVIFPMVAVGIGTSTLLSGRSLKYAAIDLTLQAQGISTGGSWILRLLTAAILAMSVTVIFAPWAKRERHANVWPTYLFFAFAAFFVCNNVLNSAFGTEPAFIHNLFYPFFVFAAVHATDGRQSHLPMVVGAAKIALIGLMLGSLALAALKPDMAIQPNYHGWVPGLNSRLWGVGSNANSIGPLALLLLLCEYMHPYRQRWIRWPVVALALIVFVYAQSKTVFAAAAAIILILAWYRVGRAGKGMDIRFALALIALACIALIALLFLDVGRLWDRLMLTQAGNDVTTLTGRWQIWSVAVGEWLRNPLFGYGPEIWGPAFRQRIGMQFAFSAHNQFMQSLSAAGTLGFVSLVVYLGFLVRGSLAMATATRGASMAFLAMLLIRCLTESPLTLATLFNGDFLTHLLIFQIATSAPDIANRAREQHAMQRSMRLVNS